MKVIVCIHILRKKVREMVKIIMKNALKCHSSILVISH